MVVALQMDDVCARYPGRGPPALDRVSIGVRTGEVAVVLGPNGSGKSTLLRVAAGLLDVREGRVCVLGRDLRGIERRELARLVALVPQSEPVALGFRVRDVVAMGRAPHQDRWMRARSGDGQVIEDAMARCDLARLADRRVEELSGGEQRRVALARALAQRPRVLLLDEPSAFLDVRHRLELNDVLADVVSREQIACIVAMHELDAASRLASQVLLLREGRVVAAGTPEHALTAPHLRQAFDVEVDIALHGPHGHRCFVAELLPGKARVP